MNYAVRFLNPHPVEGHNSDWPCELQSLGEGTTLPEGEGWQLMTKAAYESYLGSHSQYDTSFLVERERFLVMVEIDAKTRDIISRGFIFEEKTFSLSIQAQQNLQNIQLTMMAGSIGDVPYPTLDNRDYLLERSKMPAFVAEAFYQLNAALLSGTALKAQVNAMTQLSQLNAFVDPRT